MSQYGNNFLAEECVIGHGTSRVSGTVAMQVPQGFRNMADPQLEFLRCVKPPVEESTDICEDVEDATPPNLYGVSRSPSVIFDDDDDFKPLSPTDSGTDFVEAMSSDVGVRLAASTDNCLRTSDTASNSEPLFTEMVDSLKSETQTEDTMISEPLGGTTATAPMETTDQERCTGVIHQLEALVSTLPQPETQGTASEPSHLPVSQSLTPALQPPVILLTAAPSTTTSMSTVGFTSSQTSPPALELSPPGSIPGTQISSQVTLDTPTTPAGMSNMTIVHSPLGGLVPAIRAALQMKIDSHPRGRQAPFQNTNSHGAGSSLEVDGQGVPPSPVGTSSDAGTNSCVDSTIILSDSQSDSDNTSSVNKDPKTDISYRKRKNRNKDHEMIDNRKKKNRENASKSRLKKKQKLLSLEKKTEQLQKLNTRLKKQVLHLDGMIQKQRQGWVQRIIENSTVEPVPPQSLSPITIPEADVSSPITITEVPPRSLSPITIPEADVSSPITISEDPPEEDFLSTSVPGTVGGNPLSLAVGENSVPSTVGGSSLSEIARESPVPLTAGRCPVPLTAGESPVPNRVTKEIFSEQFLAIEREKLQISRERLKVEKENAAHQRRIVSILEEILQMKKQKQRDKEISNLPTGDI